MILGMGNPLLDISATVSTSLLAKHKLKSNDAILTEDEQIFKDLQTGYKVQIANRAVLDLRASSFLVINNVLT